LKISILGININLFSNYDETYFTVYHNLLRNQSHYITVNNVHTVIEAVKSKKYKNVINSSLISLPDGKPLSIYSKLIGNKNINRIFGPTFFEKTLEWGQKDGFKHYLFGSSEETLKKMLKNIKIKYPNATICGYYSPPYKEKFTDEENNLFLQNMNESDADIFWISLGAPKQELWMYENYKKLNHGVMIGIGAGFSYLAGETKHAPKWMKDFALEWLYRLVQEPKRLWKRYLITNSLFIWYCLLEFLHLKNFDD